MNGSQMEEGDDCLHDDCHGKMEYPPVMDCTCHVSPPCWRCLENEMQCNVCGSTAAEMPMLQDDKGERI